MTYEQALANILARSEIQIRTDKKGREFAQYYSMKAMRWIRCPIADAKIALASQEAA